MNKKGQLMSLVFGLVVFIVLWAMFFGKWVSDWGQNFILVNGSTGLEAFLISAMNIWILAGVIIGTIGAVYVGGSN